MITDAKWTFESHMACEQEHGLMYKSNYKGYKITTEIITPIKHGKFGKEKRVFYADDFKDMFGSLDELKGFIDTTIINLQGGK